jgi:hypothetical protein
MTLNGFVEKYGIKFSAELTDSNPHMTDMPAGSAHYRCRIRRGRRSMLVHFSQGPAICREPTAADVLQCLASDASGVENARGFEDWCGDYGYSTDSRSAERTYRAIEKQAADLRRVLGDAFSDLLSAESL